MTAPRGSAVERCRRLRWLRILAGCLIFSMLQACSVFSIHTGDGQPSQPVNASNIPDAVPRYEPKSKFGNPESYVVAGRKYYVRKDSRGFVERGIASWYGTKFHGQRTSSGETYNMYAMTAAHKTLPLPTYATVRNLDTGKSIVVKINDRGPFHDNRIIDLSYVAAMKLGIIDAGTGLVEVSAIDPAHYRHEEDTPVLPSTRQTQADNNAGTRGFYVQVGAFSDYGNAVKLSRQLAGLADNLLQISETTTQNRKLYRVRFGPITNVDLADQIVIKLARYGVTEHRIAIDL